MLAILFAAAFSLTASFLDARYRKVPDWLTYGGMAAGIIATAIFRGGNVDFMVGYVSMIAVGLLFGYALFRAGVWAGGDAKLFWAATCLLGTFGIADPAAPLSMFVSSLAIFAFFLFAKKIPLLARNAGRVARMASSGATSSAKKAMAWTFLAVLSGGNFWPVLALALALSLFEVPLSIGAAAFAVSMAIDPAASVRAFAYGFALLWVLGTGMAVFQSIIRPSLTAKVKVGDLREGMLPARTAILRGGRMEFFKPKFEISRLAASFSSPSKNPSDVLSKLGLLPAKGSVIAADSSRAGGLEAGEISRLKRLKKIRSLEIRTTSPFAPALCAGLLLAGFGII